MGGTTYVAERFAVSIPAGVKIDRDKGLIEGVRVVGPRSKNGRKYPGAVTAAAVGLFAAPVNVGHHFHPETLLPLPVPPGDRFGRVESPRPNEGGVNGVLRFNPKHSFADPFCWAAEHDPAQFGFSPLMRVKWLPQADADGDRVAESIIEVASVDIVSDGGTTATIFESRYVPEGAMAKPADPAEIATGLETPGAWMDFLSGLFTAMKTAKLDQTTKDAIQALVTSALSGAGSDTTPADPTADPNATQMTLNSLMRMGKVGKWAAEHLDRLLAADRLTKRQAWAADLIRTEAVPAHLVTATFSELVAESFGDETRAKRLIADRKTVTGANPADRTPPRTPPAGDKTVTLKGLVDGYAAG